MKRFFSAYRKDWLLITRDRSGLALLFIMPMALTIIMALIQDAPFRSFQNSALEIGLVNFDDGESAAELVQLLEDVQSFQMMEIEGQQELRGDKLVQDQKLQALLVIPENYSENLVASSNARVLNLADPSNKVIAGTPVEVYFDAAINPSFQALIKAQCNRIISQIELQAFLSSYGHVVPGIATDIDLATLLPQESLIVSSEQSKSEGFAYNSVQHNVPAYAIFGIFFIALALSGNIIKERDEGSAMRLKLIPNSPWPLVLGRIMAYQSIAFIQATFVFLAGIFLMPYIGLPALDITGSVAGVALLILGSGLAAAGLGQLLGALFQSQQQASATGAISIIILAALG
ncbi:MAG: ABC-2 type transport system permease protein, partial [Gammaproteobacteria bacterium]